MSTIARAVAVVGSLYGLLRNRLGLSVATPLGAQELSATIAPDRRLVVLGHEPIAGFTRDHGTVADEAAMLALHTLDSATLLVEPTFVAPGDSCIRTDDPGWRWHCISGHGTQLSDWERRPLGGALEGLATSGHTHAIAAITGLPAALDGRAATDHTHSLAQVVQSSAADGQMAAWSAPLQRWVPVDPPSGGTHWQFSTDPIRVGNYAWQYNSDTNGLFYALGVAAGDGTWTNPHTAGSVTVVLSSGWSMGNGPGELVNRVAGFGYSGNGTGFWVGVDLGSANAIDPTGYTIQKYSDSGNAPRNWVCEGSNTVLSNTVYGFEAGQWTVLDTRTNDATIATGGSQWGHFVCTPTGTKWRWLRLRNTGANSSGAQYFTPTEIEYYDGATIAVPSGYTGWASDGAGHYIPYRA